MCIRRDRDFHTSGLGRMDVDVVQVEPVRIGIEFEKTSAPAGSSNDGLHIDVVSVALADQPAGWMGNDRDMAIVHRANDSLGLSLAGEIEFVMHGSDGQIEPG